MKIKTIVLEKQKIFLEKENIMERDQEFIILIINKFNVEIELIFKWCRKKQYVKTKKYLYKYFRWQWYTMKRIADMFNVNHWSIVYLINQKKNLF